MGKRSNSDKIEKIQKKIRRLQEKLDKKKEEEEGTPPGSPSPRPEIGSEVGEDQIPIEIESDNDIPEDLIAALGKEGVTEVNMGPPIHSQLETRWANIIKSGLSKEDLEMIAKRYPVPINCKSMTPPKINAEILATLSQTSRNRDQRLVSRQMIAGKVLTAIGNAMTNIMKGNICTKNIIKELSDAAKMTAYTFYEDNKSRRFFALANTTLTIKNALKDEHADELLFGKECGDKIKTAQTMQRTGAQIKNKIQQPPKQGNWKSPLQPYQQPRSGPYRRQQIRTQRAQPVMLKKRMQPKAAPQTRHRRR